MIYHHSVPFHLESGQVLPELHIAYEDFGTPDATKTIWICHALTANADPTDWWAGWVGANKLIDTTQYRVVCANIIGSCYGSTYALSTNPETGRRYGYDFPLLTTRDMAAAHQLLANHLHIKNIDLLMGGSLGGQQAVEWAILAPQRIQNLVLIATNARHSAWGIGFNEAQRMAIATDPTWNNPHIAPEREVAQKGLAAARAMALLSYRNYQAYQIRQTDPDENRIDNHRVISYQHYQGEKLIKRFDAFAYWTLSKAMDSHNVGRNRGGIAHALSSICAKTLTVGISSDILFPPSELQFMAQHIPHAQYVEIDSDYGHDGFLLEYEQLEKAFQGFIDL
jgi:homoserine O-acetyltransferase/O-succinyltransferase